MRVQKRCAGTLKASFEGQKTQDPGCSRISGIAFVEMRQFLTMEKEY
jgi:hypothetical protein